MLEVRADCPDLLLPPAVSEVRKYLPEIYKLPVCLGLQSGGGEEEEKGESGGPQAKHGGRQKGPVGGCSGFNKDSAFSDTKGESDSDNKWQSVS